MRQITALTAKQVSALSAEGWTCLGGVSGLYLRIRQGQRHYCYRYISPLTGKRTFVSLGSFSEMSLAKAREEATKLSLLVKDGTDIADLRRRERLKLRKKAAEAIDPRKMAFKTIASMWLDARIKTGYYEKNVRGASVVESYLERNINPAIGATPINAIATQDVFECIRPLWLTTTEAKHKCLTIISNVFKWAKAMGFLEGENPADVRGPLGVLLANLSPHVKQSANWGALRPEEMPEFFDELLKWGTVASKALAFAILTASRSKPVRTAKWSDIDLKAGTWSCPETAMKVKGRGRFVVVLSEAAVRLLKSLPKFAGNDLVFPSPVKGGVISDAGIGQVIADMNAKAKKNGRPEWLDKAQTETLGKPVRITVHGTSRATFKTWTRLDSNLNRFDRDAVELCLAHKINDGYGGAYDRATLLEERRRIMNAWGDFCTSFRR